MSGDRLNADTAQYLQAAGANVAPPPIASDPLVAGLTPIEQLLRVLGLAANADDPPDSNDSVAGQAERDAGAILAADAFAGQDQQATSELEGIAGQNPTIQMAQQIPQLISGIAGALTGALGGALQPLVQIPQQIAQAYQAAGASDLPIDDPITGVDTEALSDSGFDGGFDGGGGAAGAGSAGGGLANTTPTGLLPPVPSAGTSPASAPVSRIAPPGAVPTSSPPAAGMAGVPMMPPGAMQGAGADKEAKTDTKRVSVPTVRNGSPVQGRITSPPIAPTVIKKVEGKPVTAKRIIAPDAGTSDIGDPARR
ncbi:hypothetical protein [Mycolicibacterium sp.]|uniref:hypothetical protein n=1 Tax=Mycolicibacterium sp. TaxID=2320850 RepID=UPI001A1CEF3C|nr:hypothetical protein [Mycolicibacterium sp.]MBJ7401470.1 hypothetical protein [Mycolicibacterium sp.]